MMEIDPGFKYKGALMGLVSNPTLPGATTEETYIDDVFKCHSNNSNTSRVVHKVSEDLY